MKCDRDSECSKEKKCALYLKPTTKIFSTPKIIRGSTGFSAGNPIMFFNQHMSLNDVSGGNQFYMGYSTTTSPDTVALLSTTLFRMPFNATITNLYGGFNSFNVMQNGVNYKVCVAVKTTTDMSLPIPLGVETNTVSIQGTGSVGILTSTDSAQVNMGDYIGIYGDFIGDDPVTGIMHGGFEIIIN